MAGRGAAILDARGASWVASAANAAIGHVQNWIYGTPADTWTSVAVVVSRTGVTRLRKACGSTGGAATALTTR